ncbi:MAG: DNA mismatch repair protein MutS [Acidobacteria bacterium]|nr:DNA mismatch repair protein MutS [Acidobacteriota bacterium]
MNPAPETPRDVYERRLAERRGAAAKLARVELAIANGRLAIAVAAVVVGWLAFHEDTLSAWWLAAPVALFALLVARHDRVIQAKQRVERAAAFYEKGIARLDHLWIGAGETGERFLDEAHLYAADLDLFGRGSLFELLCAARTSAGRAALASWLLAPAAPGAIRSRQEAVRDLERRIDLREDLAVLGDDVEADAHPQELAAWSAEPRRIPARPTRAVAAVLSILGFLSAGGWLLGFTSVLPLLLVAIAEAIFVRRISKDVDHVVAGVERAGRELQILSLVLERLERERFDAPHLAALKAALEVDGEPPSRRIARLGRLVEMLESRRNQLFAPFAAAILWTTHLALAVEAWRERSGGVVKRWLDAAGEIEALSSLAAHAYENPECVHPEIAEGGAVFEARALGHPLLADGSCVRNDVTLGGSSRVLVVSGSNMSGKSTLLRSVGINTILALAGGKVRAASLRVSPVAIGASIRIHDSLQAGTSRFYAEITRLRLIVDLTSGPLPALFLIDEMLHGTNSHDRRIGAEAIVRSLSARRSIGLITTHDLALAHIADFPAAAARNVHFEDHIEGGKITFDYVMRAGVVTKSNGIALMRAVGLDVEEAPEGSGARRSAP